MNDQEINEAVARKLGWTHRPIAMAGHPGFWTRGAYERSGIPDYCHSIAAAWEIVDSIYEEVLLEKHIDGGPGGSGYTLYRCIFPEKRLKDYDFPYTERGPAMAICLAFLKLPEKRPGEGGHQPPALKE